MDTGLELCSLSLLVILIGDGGWDVVFGLSLSVRDRRDTTCIGKRQLRRSLVECDAFRLCLPLVLMDHAWSGRGEEVRADICCLVWRGVLVGGVQFFLRGHCIPRSVIRLVEWILSRYQCRPFSLTTLSLVVVTLHVVLSNLLFWSFAHLHGLGHFFPSKTGLVNSLGGVKGVMARVCLTSCQAPLVHRMLVYLNRLDISYTSVSEFSRHLRYRLSIASSQPNLVSTVPQISSRISITHHSSNQSSASSKSRNAFEHT